MEPARGLETAGRRALCEWLRSPANTQSELAKRLELGQSSVSLWVHGRSRPEPHLRVAIELIAGIPSDAWLTEDESSLIERVRTQVVTSASGASRVGGIASPRRVTGRAVAAKAAPRKRYVA